MTDDTVTQILVALRGVTLRGTRLDMSAEDIADAIWLAAHLDVPAAGPDTSGDEAPARPAAEDVAKTPEPEADEEPDGMPMPMSEAENARRMKGQRGDLYLPGAGGTGRGGRPLRVPTGSALPGSLALARALRPLRRRVPSRTRRTLDIAETVRRVAEEGIWLPALRPARDRWLDLSLVVDSGASMGPWRSTATELLKLLSCLGAFRTIRVWNLETDVDLPRLRAGLVHRGGAPQRNPRELVDPAGRSLVVVLTDCVATTWYDGGVAQLLETWARSGPVALLLVLPEHLWPRTALGTAAAVRLTAPHAAAPNARLAARLIDDWGDRPERAAAPLAVASLVPEALSAWARLVAGAGGAESAGFVLERPAQRAPAVSWIAPTPEARLSRFWRAASPTARRLAGLLAASPVISLPVIRLIRQALLSEARQVHEAEVLLGGLLKVVTPLGETAPDPDEIRYEFRDGLRSLLLDAVPTADALTVLEQVSTYVEEHLDSGVDFRAVLADPTAARGALVADESPFARVAAQVLLRLGGDYARLVAALPVHDGSSLGAAVREAGMAGPTSPPGRIGAAPPLQDPPPLPGQAPRRAERLQSFQHKLSRVRSPRVQITYDVETNGAMRKSELPFVVGVLADLSGQPSSPLRPLRERKAVFIDRDNFDDVLARAMPRVTMKVQNVLTDTNSKLAVELKFKSIDDFEPDKIAEQVGPLKELMAMRQKLAQLLSKLDGNDKLEQLLGDLVSNPDLARELAKQLGIDGRDPRATATETEKTP